MDIKHINCSVTSGLEEQYSVQRNQAIAAAGSEPGDSRTIGVKKAIAVPIW